MLYYISLLLISLAAWFVVLWLYRTVVGVGKNAHKTKHPCARVDPTSHLKDIVPTTLNNGLISLTGSQTVRQCDFLVSGDLDSHINFLDPHAFIGEWPQ